MRWLTRLRGERGAVLVLVAIAIVALIGMTGLAIDVGAVYGTRTELSRGADAVALAVAQECAADPAGCSTDAHQEMAQHYASANLDNGSATLHGFEVNATERWVEVVTESFHDAAFLRVLGFTGTTVRARAVAIWGFLGAGAVAPFTFPTCVYDDIALEVEFIYLFKNIGETDCEGLSPPGGFGFLDVEDACTTDTAEDDTAPGDPGTDWPCTQADKEALQDAIILVPLHDPDKTVGSGSFAEYYIEGFAAFRVTGYRLPGGAGPPAWPSGFTCGTGTSSACIRGKFVEMTVWDGPLGDTDFGVTVVRLTE